APFGGVDQDFAFHRRPSLPIGNFAVTLDLHAGDDLPGFLNLPDRRTQYQVKDALAFGVAEQGVEDALSDARLERRVAESVRGLRVDAERLVMGPDMSAEFAIQPALADDGDAFIHRSDGGG